ncbi:MAG: D-tyrosyl-tRNA(Tyr) deacylase [Oscillospiraceae bacterium]|nr:D-tyrosyl-tRNA(Tyr) deacylase [Oscillospiraceae bacterium]MBR2503534.1 D-tyrosyl-tRNA(Tyr) deacylase [Oscillospiraceae bacterium]
MRAVVQRVKDAWITVNGGEKQYMEQGLVVLFGVNDTDEAKDTAVLAKKISELRIFEDEDGKMNISALDKNYSCMVVSQFTLFADTKKGRRPSFIKAARPEKAIPIYEKFLSEIETAGFKKVIHGEFGADMQINLTNDGPVTIILDTDEWKAQ